VNGEVCYKVCLKVHYRFPDEHDVLMSAASNALTVRYDIGFVSSCGLAVSPLFAYCDLQSAVLEYGFDLFSMPTHRHFFIFKAIGYDRIEPVPGYILDSLRTPYEIETFWKDALKGKISNRFGSTRRTPLGTVLYKSIELVEEVDLEECKKLVVEVVEGKM
jgi:hypothetical protein